MRALVQAFPARPLPPDEAETLLCSSMTVPARIRASLVARDIDGRPDPPGPRMTGGRRASFVTLPGRGAAILGPIQVGGPGGRVESGMSA
jgi:hypothetical protein